MPKSTKPQATEIVKAIRAAQRKAQRLSRELDSDTYPASHFWEKGRAEALGDALRIIAEHSPTAPTQRPRAGKRTK